MVIIGFIATAIIVTFSRSSARARDVKRINDIAVMKAALDQYYQDYGVYPDACGLDIACDTSLLYPVLSDYMSEPLFDTILPYEYASFDSDPYSYVISVFLEDGTECKTGERIPDDYWVELPICDFQF